MISSVKASSIALAIAFCASVLNYSLFIPFNIGSTSNPFYILLFFCIFLYLQPLVYANIVQICNRVIISILFSTIIVFFSQNTALTFDFRFLLTSFVFISLFNLFRLFSIWHIRLPLFLQVRSYQILIDTSICCTILGLVINLIGLQCLFFKCRVLDSITSAQANGISLFNAEPSYVGIFTFFIISLYFQKSLTIFFP